MKKIIGLVIALAVCFMFSWTLTEARVRILLPPPIVFAAPPDVIELPEGGVYVVPDVNEEIYFSDGYWWRPYGGRWYRSYRYDGGWEFYGGSPSWYGGARGWRQNYENHRWGGREWNHSRIPHNEFRNRPHRR